MPKEENGKIRKRKEEWRREVERVDQRRRVGKRKEKQSMM